MTAGILRANAHPIEQKTLFLSSFLGDYHLKGIFYDHKTSTIGLVAEGSQLEEYVRTHKKDPINEIGAIKSWEDTFANLIGSNLIRVFTYPNSSPHEIIRRNYDAFEVYERRNGC